MKNEKNSKKKQLKNGICIFMKWKMVISKTKNQKVYKLLV